MTDIPVTTRSLTDDIALEDIERALSTSDTSDRHMDAAVALDGFERRIDLLGLAGATTVLRHRASASRARRIELRDLRTVKLAVLRERAADRLAVAR